MIVNSERQWSNVEVVKLPVIHMHTLVMHNQINKMILIYL